MQTTTSNLPFALDGKALTATESATGDLLVSGLAASWDGLDFQNENFLRGAFRESIPAFLAGQAPLLFHHRSELGIGRVLELRETDKGLEFKALVHKQEPTSPLYYVYDAVKRGIYRGVSVGGYFARQMTAAGKRIKGARLTEISLTPAAAHPGTYANVVSVKALLSGAPQPDYEDLARRLVNIDRAHGREVAALRRRVYDSEPETDEARRVREALNRARGRWIANV